MPYIWKLRSSTSCYKSKKTFPRGLPTEFPCVSLVGAFVLINQFKKNGISKTDRNWSEFISGLHGGVMDNETDLGDREGTTVVETT